MTVQDRRIHELVNGSALPWQLVVPIPKFAFILRRSPSDTGGVQSEVRFWWANRKPSTRYETYRFWTDTVEKGICREVLSNIDSSSRATAQS